jgi:PhnB protein
MATVEQSAQQIAMPGVTPHITIRNRKAAEAIEFYKKAFGAQEQSRHPSDDGRLMHAHLNINGGALMMHDEFPEHMGPAKEPAGTVLHLEVDDADKWWERALAAGAEVTFPISNQFWGARYGQLGDPFGHTWSIAGPVTEG